MSGSYTYLFENKLVFCKFNLMFELMEIVDFKKKFPCNNLSRKFKIDIDIFVNENSLHIKGNLLYQWNSKILEKLLLEKLSHIFFQEGYYYS